MAKNANISKFAGLLRKPWYTMWRVIAAAFYNNHEYSIQVPQGQRIFTPWNNLRQPTEFAQVWDKAQKSGPMAVSTDRCYMLYQFLMHALHLNGDIVECGVYTGGTAYLLAQILANNNQHRCKLHLFDTFEGMPDTSQPERDYHKPGDFSDTSLSQVQSRLSDFSHFCEFHPGFIPDTFAQLPDKSNYALVHVDVDIYPSVMDCCKYFWPRMSLGGIMVFDDYGFYPYRYAARAAVDEYFASRNAKPIALPTGQALVLKAAHD